MQRSMLLYVLTAFLTCLLSKSSAQQCAVVSFPAESQGYQYEANFTQMANCSTADFNVSRLYLTGACLRNRDNGVSLDCEQEGGTVNSTTASCDAVFAAASSDNFADRSRLQSVFDSNLICATGRVANIYVSTTCSSFNTTWIELNNVTDPNDCLVVGDTYHRGAAIAIAVAACAFLLLLVSGWAFWYRRSNRRATAYEPQQDINMQPYSHEATGYQGYSSSSLPGQQDPTNERIPRQPASGTVQGTMAQGTPVYSPWTGGGFKPDR